MEDGQGPAACRDVLQLRRQYFMICDLDRRRSFAMEIRFLVPFDAVASIGIGIASRCVHALVLGRFDFDQAFCILVLVEFSRDSRLNLVTSATPIARYVMGTSNVIRIFDTLTGLYISRTLHFLGSNDPENQPEYLRWHIVFR
jgi:hypothetical protein